MPRMPAMPPQRLLLQARRNAANAVREVARMAKAAQAHLRPEAVRRKGEGDFVTTVDVRAEEQLKKHLLGALPEAGFIGEETGCEESERELVWVVDPIDGTSNFARGLPHWAVAVALLYRGLPIVASMWCSPEQVLYEAVRGRGAFRAGRRLTMRPGRWDDGTLVGCQWHRGQQDMSFVERLQSEGCRIRTFGCTVVQICDVAHGHLDANVQQQGRLWDIAAPGLLIEAAGGQFTDWQGKPVFPVDGPDPGHLSTVAAHGPVHASILRRACS